MIIKDDFFDGSFMGLIKKERPELFTLFYSGPEIRAEKDIPVFKSGTTIIAAKYNEGVIMTGDRRASSGYLIANARAEKIHAVDRFTVIGSAGTSKICEDLAKIFRAELEYYEKIRGREMTFEAKIKRLGYLTSLNLRGFQLGIYAVPILAGYDKDRRTGRIFKFDVLGSPSEELKYVSTGSGAISTTGSLPTLYEDEPAQVRQEELIRRLLKAFKSVMKTDMGSGIDPAEGIWPNFKTIDKSGVKDVPEPELKRIWDSLATRGE